MEDMKRCKFDFVAFLAVLILIAFIGCMCVAIAFGIKQQKNLLNVAYADYVPFEVNDVVSQFYYNVDFDPRTIISYLNRSIAVRVDSFYEYTFIGGTIMGSTPVGLKMYVLYAGDTFENFSSSADECFILGFIDQNAPLYDSAGLLGNVFGWNSTEITTDNNFINQYNVTITDLLYQDYFRFFISKNSDFYNSDSGDYNTGYSDGYLDGYNSGIQYGYEHYNLVSAYQFENSIDSTLIGLNNIRSAMASGESGAGVNSPVNTPNHRGKYYDFTFNGELFAKQDFQRYFYSFEPNGSYSVSVPANGGFDNIAAVSTLYLGSAYIGNLFLTFNNAVNDVGFIAVNGSDVRLFRFRQDTIIDNVSCFLVDNYLSAGVLYDFFLVPSSPTDTLLTNTALTVSGMTVVSGIGYYAIYRIKDEMNYEQVYNDGRQAGFDDAVQANAQNVANARSAGYEEGRRDALADSNDYSFMGLIGAVFDAPIKSFQGLLNFDVLGVNMQSFVLALLSLSVIIIIIRIALGGK